MNIDREVALMKLMSVGELRKKYCEVFKEPTNGRNKVWLIKRIAWRMQANVEGDLSERARRRAMEIANDADLRMMPPRERKPREVVQQPNTVVVKVDTKPARSLSVGQSLQRFLQGAEHRRGCPSRWLRMARAEVQVAHSSCQSCDR